MNTFGDSLKLLIGGVVAIGMATALFSSGRQTTQAIGAAGTATQGVLGTAIKG